MKIVLVSENKPIDNMTTEAYYRMIRILKPLCDKLSFIAVNFNPEDDRVEHGVDIIKCNSVVSILKNLLGHRAIYMFWFGGSRKIAFTITLFKLLSPKSKVILRIDGSSSITYKNKNVFKYWMHKITEIIIYGLVDIVACQYEGLEQDYELQKYHHKIMIANQYIDISRFKNLYRERCYDLGYVGRLDEAKGIKLFLEAIYVLVYKYGLTLKSIVVGEGELKEWATNYIKDNKLPVDMHGKDVIYAIPYLLNMIKYVVIPSKREGVPKVLIESMACGCIPITSKAGGLKYLVKDNETGYLISELYSKCVAGTIVNCLLNVDKHDKIVINNEKLVKWYTLGNTQNRYNDIISRVMR